VQFITFRLVDSLPEAIALSIRHREDDVHRIDRELDLGTGDCWLRHVEVAEVVESALLHFDGQRHRLLAWCIMPNHGHLVIEAREGHSLSDVVRNWKSFTAHRANMFLGRSGRFWQSDYFDRYMRNEEHLAQTVEYVEQNPVKAGLILRAEEWKWSSARLRKDS
jgi:putative transposase